MKPFPASPRCHIPPFPYAFQHPLHHRGIFSRSMNSPAIYPLIRSHASSQPSPLRVDARDSEVLVSKLPNQGLPTIRAASLHRALVSVLRIRMLIRDSHPHNLRAQTQAHHLRNEPLISQPFHEASFGGRRRCSATQSILIRDMGD